MPDRVEFERRGSLVLKRTYADKPNESGVVAERLVSEEGWDFLGDVISAIQKLNLLRKG